MKASGSFTGLWFGRRFSSSSSAPVLLPAAKEVPQAGYQLSSLPFVCLRIDFGTLLGDEPMLTDAAAPSYSLA